MIDIPVNTYDSALFKWATTYPCVDDFEQLQKDLLVRLLYGDFTTWNLLSFSELDRTLIRQYKWDGNENKEIQARANEVLLAEIKDKRSLRIKISNLYI